MGSVDTGPREWDAETYDEVSDPQFAWGLEVLERLAREDGDQRLEAQDLLAGAGRERGVRAQASELGRVLEH